jgi:putative flippase GtrA
MPALSRSVVEAVRPLLANAAVGQLLRFAIAGLGVTLLAAGVYLAAATAFHVPPLVANTISTACGVGDGYLVHSRWSFRASGEREAVMAARFLLAAAGAFALNSFWVWLAVHAFHLPSWTPVTGMIFATPLASFAVNRYWVFA